jgi:hypothetical protein
VGDQPWVIERIDLISRRSALVSDCRLLHIQPKERMRGEVVKITNTTLNESTRISIVHRSIRLSGTPKRNISLYLAIFQRETKKRCINYKYANQIKSRMKNSKRVDHPCLSGLCLVLVSVLLLFPYPFPCLFIHLSSLESPLTRCHRLPRRGSGSHSCSSLVPSCSSSLLCICIDSCS